MSNRPGPLAQRIAAEIRAELGRQNQSRRWLAEQIGQSHVTVSRWVNGDGPMSFDALDDICRALAISVADLLVAADRSTATPSPRPPQTRRRASTSTGGAEAADNRQGSSRDTRRLLAPAVAA